MTLYRDYSGAARTNPTATELAERRAAYMALRPEPKPRVRAPKSKPQRAPRELKPKGAVLPIYLQSECKGRERYCVHRRDGVGGPGATQPWCEWYGFDVPKGHKRPLECINDARNGLIDDVEQTEAAE